MANRQNRRVGMSRSQVIRRDRIRIKTVYSSLQILEFVPQRKASRRASTVEVSLQ